MQNGNKVIGYIVGLAALGLTVYIISKTLKAGQK